MCVFMEVSSCLVGLNPRIKVAVLWLLEGNVLLGIVNLHHLHPSGTRRLVRWRLRKGPGP